MILAVGMSTGLTLIQTIGAYLRYLPFEEKLTMEERTRLWKYILLWMPVAFTIYLAYFSYAGVDVFTYKHVHYFGWIPFFAFSLVVIRNEGMRHLFVAGMQALWFMLLQTISGTLILTFMPPFYGTGVNRLPVQTAFYIFFFIVLLPVEQRIFRNLVPSNMFTGSKIAGWCFAMLPLGICAAPLITLIERPLMYTWTDRLSRFFLLLWGFVLYQYSLYAGRRAAKIRNEEHTNELLTQQLNAMGSYMRLLKSREEDVRRMRHDLRHYNRLLVTLLQSGEVDKALDLIEVQDRDLLTKPIDTYCESPIVNAALTIYMQLAEQDGIRRTCDVDIDNPNRPTDGDNDLSIMLSNIIENAVIASRKQPKGKREISVSLVYDSLQYALIVKNRFDTPVLLGKDGLPQTKERGHGVGMLSLRNFIEKYGAEVFFEQKDGWVRLLMYWSGK